MVNSILKYIEPQLKAYMQFLNRVDSPVFRISNGEMVKGNGQEKEVVTISDLNGNSLYIRQTQPEITTERKALSSCDKEYNISARCKVVFYSFGGNDFTINPDKVKSKIVNTLARLDFSHYVGSSTEIKIDVNGTSLDTEKIYTEETGKEFSGNVWPTLVSVDFTLSYVDTNCNTCDIDDNETVVTWTPDLTPENCETKAICEVISKCDVITLLQEKTASLQEQIDNLPTEGLTCDDLPNCQTIIDILQSISDIISGLPSSYFSCDDLEFCQTIIDIVSDISSLQTQVGTNTTDISNLSITVQALVNDMTSLIQSVTDIDTALNSHILNTSNPHQVTLEQARSQNSSISGDINANNNTIINLKDAVNPQEPITKMQFDTYVSAVGGQRGSIDCSTNPNYPASNKGDRWEVVVAGKIGGALGIDVQVYDEIVCKTTSTAGDQATVGANFYVVQGNLERATETVAGYIQLATDAEVQAGIENTKAVTALKLENWWANIKTLTLTFAAKITFTSAPRFNSASASQYLKTNGTKDLTSVSSIPSTDISGLASEILGQALTGLSLVTSQTIAATDTILQAFGYLQAQVTANAASIASKANAPTITDISLTSTVTGWSSFTTKQIQELVEGNKVTVFFYISGVSNTTDARFTCTNNANNIISNYYSGVQVVNNGIAATNAARATIAASSNEINVNTNWAGTGTFTASGTKSIRGTFIYYK